MPLTRRNAGIDVGCWSTVSAFAMGIQMVKPNGSGPVAISFGEEHQPDWGTVPIVP